MLVPSVRVLLVGGLPDTPLLQEKLSTDGFDLLSIVNVNGFAGAIEKLGSDPFDIVVLDHSASERYGSRRLLPCGASSRISQYYGT